MKTLLFFLCFSQKSLDFVSLLPYNASRDSPNCTDGVGVVLNNSIYKYLINVEN